MQENLEKTNKNAVHKNRRNISDNFLNVSYGNMNVDIISTYSKQRYILFTFYVLFIVVVSI